MFNLIFEVMEKKERDGKVINPFLDWSFKYLFGTPESKSNLIGLLNLVLSPDVEIEDVDLYDVRGQKVFSDKLNIVLLQLPCLRARSIHECSQQYEFLLYLLNQMHKGMKTIEELKLEVAQTALPEETKELFYKVLDTADVASLSESDRIQYESDLKNYRDTMSCIEIAEYKGKKEGKIETAAKMKANGISLDVIAECTGLSEEKIQKL